MPAAKTKAELQEQKAKVSAYACVCLGRLPVRIVKTSTNIAEIHSSLPIPTMNYWSKAFAQKIAEFDSNICTREFSSKELRSVGNYTLGRLIGKGSFGKVYLASHKLTNGSKVRYMSQIGS